jgi:triacylglycerol lipase
MYPLFILGLLLLGPSAVDAGSKSEPAARGPECVILLHGLGRTSRSLNKMADALQAAGFRAVNLDYPSRKKTIDELAPETIERGLTRCNQMQARTVHFVTHSMGGVLVRYYISHHRPGNLGRVVMLSPPNRGSEAADHLRDTALYTWFNGPAGQQLVTGPEGLPEQLGPVDFSLGIMTGTDDGKVSVEQAKVEGMADFLVLPYSHPFIMNAEEVIDQTLHFLRGGRCGARSPLAEGSSD